MSIIFFFFKVERKLLTLFIFNHNCELHPNDFFFFLFLTPYIILFIKYGILKLFLNKINLFAALDLIYVI